MCAGSTEFSERGHWSISPYLGEIEGGVCSWEFGVSKEKTSRRDDVKHANRQACQLYSPCYPSENAEHVRKEGDPDTGKCAKAVNEDDLPNFTKTTLWRLMKDMGFTYDKRIQNLGIIVWHRRYLRAIKEFRRQGRGYR
ncbi:hypothetical protein HPB48_021764 [Haemaphysalis longicornis]|uniref:Uncharacterized protein n=1 Tax=Haemaphysalis longicornis TaxID=44386 RepID=A0A9J6GSG0_HAELO|nr:hypothetical protein HPB48_021764 [Haemaphysalis longicornis]